MITINKMNIIINSKCPKVFIQFNKVLKMASWLIIYCDSHIRTLVESMRRLLLAGEQSSFTNRTHSFRFIMDYSR